MVLYLVPVPIGNLGDITFRAVETLKSVDLIIAEDTRYSLKLLNHLGIKKRMVSYFRPREQEKAVQITALLTRGEYQTAALITDSGTPGISDPGYILVRQALEEGIQVIPLPGPTAFAPALTASGLNPGRFLFLGFPPRKAGEIKQFLQEFSSLPFPLVFYESPRRVERFLEIATQVLGNRSFTLSKEISKKNEAIIRGNLGDLKRLLDGFTLLGEMVVVIDGADTKKEESQERLMIETLEDIYRYFKERHDISRNQLKRVLMKRDGSR